MHPEIYDQYQTQSQLQGEAAEQQMGMYGPQMQEQMAQSQAVLVEQTNPDKVLEEIILKLKGLKKQMDGSLIRVGEPLMNSLGVNRITLIMSSIINQNTILSDLERSEINNLTLSVSKNLLLDLAQHWREYEIKDRAMLNHIVATVIFPAFLSLRRAYLKGEKNWLKSFMTEIVSGRPSMNMPKKEGFWGKFKL